MFKRRKKDSSSQPITTPDAQAFKRHVVIATPSYGFHFCGDYMRSMIATDRMLISLGIAVNYVGVPGDCYLSKARSKIATLFLEDYPQADSLFFIDDDVGGWPAEKVVEFVLRNEEIVAGIYPKKCDHIDFPGILLGDKADGGKPIISNGLVAASMVPTGFLRIKRTALEKLAPTCRSFKTVDTSDVSKTRVYKEIFKMGVDYDGGDWVGEDPWFCREMRALGVDLWVDPNITFTHQGTKVWKGRLADYLDQTGMRVPVQTPDQELAAS